MVTRRMPGIFTPGVLRFSFLFVMGLVGFLGTVSPVNAGKNVVVIQNDRGGAVDKRAAIIKRYRARGTHIEIRGDYCLSACTMYLSLPNLCIAPDTEFGFHGPSSPHYGIGLAPAAFEHWSRVIADHYPRPLRDWYLVIGRNRIVGFHTKSGSELIQMGIPSCVDA